MRAHIAAALLALAAASLPALAQITDDKAALAGLQTLKAAFDVKEGDARALLYRLKIIDETRQSLIRQGVKPEFVVAFRGQATKFAQSDLREIEPEDRPVAREIAAKIAEMSAAPGMHSVEQCAVAIRDQGTRADRVLPQVRIVGNAWISLMAYQARGYAYIAP